MAAAVCLSMVGLASARAEGQFAAMTADGGGRSERQNKFGTLAMKARADCYTFCYTAARPLQRFLRYRCLWVDEQSAIK
jgi:hypothetical protein